ncbi:MAG TPA: polyphosphate kinase [Sphingomicrobium sp.]|nr:polyphosphate kinase [Sphingomicrobium sp.]
MAIVLTQYEQGKQFPGDAAAALAVLQGRLVKLNQAQVAHGRRLIVLLEGWDGSGRKTVLRQMLGALDPCLAAVHCGSAAVFAEEERHWLTPFWTRLPKAAETSLYYGSWYRRPIHERASGAMDDAHWARSFDEINEFEAQQLDSGTLLVKLFFHVSEAVRDRRLRARAADPWVNATLVNTKQLDRDEVMKALEAMFKATDTRWAPWTVIDANDESAAQIAALSKVAEVLEKKLPKQPPASDAVVAFPKTA